ncbi:MAG: hypothetical protein ACP5KB_02595 [Thermoprotei archaeon]
MRGASSRNVVAICNPKLMSTFKNLSDLLDIHFKVFELRDNLSEVSTLIADEECLELIRRSHDISKVKVVKISEDNIMLRLLEVVGVSRVETIVVGVDPGNTIINYVIFADNVLLGFGSTREFLDLVDVLNKVRSSLRPEKVVIKVGVSPAGLWKSFMSEISRVVSNEDRYSLVLVDENSTTGTCPTTYIGKKDLKNPDLRACINIALREGFIKTARLGVCGELSK